MRRLYRKLVLYNPKTLHSALGGLSPLTVLGSETAVLFMTRPVSDRPRSWSWSWSCSFGLGLSLGLILLILLSTLLCPLNCKEVDKLR